MGPLGLLRQLASQRNLREGGAFWAGGGPYEGKLGPWSTLTIDGKIFPGADSYRDGSQDDTDGGVAAVAVTIDDGSIRYRLDNQRGHGKSGSKKVVHGYEPAQLIAKAWIYTAAQWLAFQAYLPVIHPKNQPSKRRVFQVQHPVLSAYSLTQFYINEVELPKDADNRMVKTVSIHMEEVYDLKGKATKVRQKDTEVGGGINVQTPFKFEEGPRLQSQ